MNKDTIEWVDAAGIGMLISALIVSVVMVVMSIAEMHYYIIFTGKTELMLVWMVLLCLGSLVRSTAVDLELKRAAGNRHRKTTPIGEWD